MATYIPNATQTTEPVESRTVESAALEFRTLKTSINARIEDVQDELDTEIVNRIAGDAQLQTQNNAQDVRLQAIEAALLVIGEGGLPGTVYVQRFSGTGAQTSFTLNVSVPSSALIDVFINGIYQNKNTFTIVDDVLTFSEAPPAGTDNVEVVISITIANVETDASLVSFRATDSTAVVRTAQDKMRELVSVKDFGAVGDGSDATAAFVLAQTFCAANGVDLYIPTGAYRISAPLAWPNYYQIHGDGFGTNLILALTAGQFCFTETANYRYAWSIRNIRFTVASGASTDVGALRLAKHLRGGEVENVWTYELEQPFYFGTQIYANLRVNGIRAYRVATSTPTPRTAFYAEGEANTFMCDDIEIIGSWTRGFHINGGRVGSLTNFDIAGSVGYEMVEGVRIENYGNFQLETGWVEQLTVLNTAAAVYVKNSSDVLVKNVNVASGSLYFDGGSDNTAEGIYYGNANGGLKILNDAVVNVYSSALKFQADAVGFANGQAYQVDAPRLNAGGLYKNPTMLPGLPNHVGRTNVSLVTIADNTTTFDSGSLSRELTTATNFQGAQFDAPCVAGRLYTCVVRAMLVENATDLYIGQGTNTTRNGTFLYNRGTGTLGQWRSFIITGSSSTSTISFRLLVNGVSGTARFLVDSVQIYEGVNHAPPQLYADPGFRESSGTYDPPSLADGAGVTTTVTVNGAAVGDWAVPSFSDDLQGITLTAWVSAANTVSVRFQNESGGPLDLASGTLRARVFKV